MNDRGRGAVVLDTGAVTRGSGAKNDDKERNMGTLNGSAGHGTAFIGTGYGGRCDDDRRPVGAKERDGSQICCQICCQPGRRAGQRGPARSTEPPDLKSQAPVWGIPEHA